MYNNLLLFSPLSHVISMLTVLLFYVSVRHDLTAQFKYEHSVTSWWIQLRAWVLNVPTQVWCTPQWIFHDRKVKYVCRFFSYQLLLYNNRLLYIVMYNMEIYCTSLYCIENPYWTRRLVQYRFSIQYRRVQYISILYITLYNDLFIIQLKWSIL
jgi:hypothetical protein